MKSCKLFEYPCNSSEKLKKSWKSRSLKAKSFRFSGSYGYHAHHHEKLMLRLNTHRIIEEKNHSIFFKLCFANATAFRNDLVEGVQNLK